LFPKFQFRERKKKGIPNDAVIHVVNPRKFHWTNELLPAIKKCQIDFQEVDQRVWLKMLKEGDQDPRKNPTIKLAEFYSDKYDCDPNENKFGKIFHTKMMNNFGGISTDGINVLNLVPLFIKYWEL